ncbi:predicted protein [Naegleria gruberi]|uniref:Predicted protein n=1 Tax=Naegleria gruberi TaxID=5762 RepID=D2V4L0_NAEGR|nr:uncharacterized protein NAEGRDRAFT_63828 [Naegleria gruberi]EFC48118.1 predicted protein [Naegleria gruberi]|eukprot:XP_002680862.1 predicted protein [Naegleria gruberi strain NEG-M]
MLSVTKSISLSVSDDSKINITSSSNNNNNNTTATQTKHRSLKEHQHKYHNRFLSDASTITTTTYAGLNSNFSPNVSFVSLNPQQNITYIITNKSNSKTESDHDLNSVIEEGAETERILDLHNGYGDANTIVLDQKWSLFRDVRVLNEQLDNLIGKYYKDDDRDPTCATTEEYETLLANEMTKRLEIAQIHREHKQFAESFAQLSRVEELATNNQYGKFVPKIELLHSKCLFLKSIILKQKKKVDDANEYLESAQEKTDALLQSVAPSDFICSNSPSFIVLSTRILHSEILLCLAEEMINSQDMSEIIKPTFNSLEMTISEKKYLYKVLASFLVPALRDLTSYTSTGFVSVLNLEVFLLIVYYMGICLRALSEMELAKRVLHLVNRLGKGSTLIFSSMEEIDMPEDACSENFSELELEIYGKMDKVLKEIEQKEKTNTDLPKKSKWQEDSDESDSESDWGDEIDFNSAPKSSLAGILFGDKTDDRESKDEENDLFEEEFFPNKYRLFKSRTYKEELMLPEVVLTKGLIGGKSFHEGKRELLLWFQSLIPKKVKDQNVIDSCSRDDLTNFLLSRLEKRVQSYDFSMEFIENFYEICYRLIHIAKEQITTQSILVKFFENMTPEVVNKLALNERAYLFHICVDLLKSANSTRLFNLEDPKQSAQYTEMISLLFNAYPTQRASIIVLQCEIQIKYHIFQLETGMFPDFDSISEVFTTLAMIFNEVFDIPEEGMENNALFYSVVDQKIRDAPIFVGSSTMGTTFNSPYFSFPSLCDCGALIVTLLELYDSTLRKHAGSETWIPQFRHPLLSSHERIAVMFSKFYSRMGISKNKAYVAYSLGSFWAKQGDSDMTRLGECALFESVYLFQKCPPLCVGIPTIVSAEALKAMRKFGDALYSNRKPQYASIIYEMYTQNYRLLSSDHDYKFIDELAALAVKSDDWSRSIRYYTILNEKACRDKRVAVIANISSKLSALFMEKGEFRNAERVKRDALETIKSLSSSFDFKMELEIDYAKLLLNGGNLERCVNICLGLIQSSLSIKNPDLYITLAEAYLKKKWFKECERVLKELEMIMENNFMQLQQQQEMRLLEIITKYYMKRSMFGNSIETINIALYRCNRTFSTLAQLFKLKGKILMSVAKWSHPISFPNELIPSEKDRLSILTLIQKSEVLRDAPKEKYLYSKRPVYDSLAIIISDSVDCFQKAKKYYEACSNEISLAKMDILIAQVLVDYMFTPVTVMSKKPEDYLDLCSNDSKMTYIDLEEVFNDYIEPTLDVAVTASDVFMCMDVNLTAAECRYLQGRTHSSKKYWCEMRDIFFTLFVDNSSQVVVSSGATPAMLEKILLLLKRCVRLLLLFETTFINTNIGVFDTFYILSMEYEMSLKRTQEPTCLSIEQNDAKVTRISCFIDPELLDKNKPYEGLNKVNTPSTLTLPLKGFSFSSMLRSPTLKSSLDATYKIEPKEDSHRTHLKHRVCERLFYCLLSMKFDRRKYPGEIDGQLRFKNQQSMRRLYNLMNAVRESKLSTHKKRSFYNKSSKLSNDSTKTINSIELLDSSNLTLLPGDKSVVESLLSTFNESKGVLISGTLKNTMNLQVIDANTHNANVQKQASLAPCLTPLKRAFKKLKKTKCFERIVLLSHFDNVISFYIPNLLQKKFVSFGGKLFLNTEHDVAKVNDTFDPNASFSRLLGSVSTNIFYKTIHSMEKTEDVSMSEFIKAIITESMRDKKEKIMNKSNIAMLKDHFSSINDILSYKPDPVQFLENAEYMKRNGFDKFNYCSSMNQKTSTFTKKKSVPMPKPEMIPTPSTPITLIAPTSLQAIPWELIFEENAVRCMSIRDILTRSKKRVESGFVPKNKTRPKFFCFYSSDDPKFIQSAEDERKYWIWSNVMCEKLHLVPTCETRENDDVKINMPFHIPIVKYGKKPSSKSYKKKYEHIEFLKLSKVLSDIPRVIKSVESSIEDDQYPVFLFPWTDLLDATSLHLQITQSLPSSMMTFVPDGCYRKFVEFLMVMYECYWSETTSLPMQPLTSNTSSTGSSPEPAPELKLTKFLTQCLSILRNEKEYSMPLIMFP